MLDPYRDLLRRPGAWQFSAAGLVSRLPMSMAGIGTVLMVQALYGSYALAGRVSAAYVLTQAVCGPPLARLVDRHGQARVMRPAIALAALGLVGLVVAGWQRAPEGWLYAAAVLTGATIGSMGALVRARWSVLLGDPGELHTAYSLESALDEVTFIVGPVVATTLAASVSPYAALLVPVVAMLGGGYWFLALRGTEPSAEPVPARAAGVARPGSVLRSGGMVAVIGVFVAMGGIFGATDVSTVALAGEQHRASQAGLVLAVFALGSMLSGLVYGARSWVAPLWRRFAVGTVALALGSSLFVLADSVGALAAIMFVAGLAIAPTIINGNGLAQELVPAARLTEGLAWLSTAMGAGVSVGASVAGSAIDRAGSHGGFLVVVTSAGLAVVVTGVSLGWLRRGRPRVELVAPEAAEPPAAPLG